MDYREEGNSLLASMGERLRVHNQIWQEVDEVQTEEDFQEPRATNLLSCLQSDIYHLQNGSHAVAADDDSVQIHVCHSHRREVEVLHDRLLGLFAARPDLSPSDVLVMAPDIQPFEPFYTLGIRYRSG